MTRIDLLPVPNRRGFTIIEAMIVAAIIGILFSIAVPQLIDVWSKAHMTESQRQELYDIEVFCKMMGVQTYDFQRSKLLQKKFEDYKAGRFAPGHPAQ